MIDRLVFQRAGSGERRTPQTKGWRCPGCGRAVGADTLGNLEHGWMLTDSGRWWVKGDCPGCRARLQFTKAGSAVLARDVVGRMVTMVRKKKGPGVI